MEQRSVGNSYCTLAIRLGRGTFRDLEVGSFYNIATVLNLSPTFTDLLVLAVLRTKHIFGGYKIISLK